MSKSIDRTRVYSFSVRELEKANLFEESISKILKEWNEYNNDLFKKSSSQVFKEIEQLTSMLGDSIYVIKYASYPDNDLKRLDYLQDIDKIYVRVSRDRLECTECQAPICIRLANNHNKCCKCYRGSYLLTFNEYVSENVRTEDEITEQEARRDYSIYKHDNRPDDECNFCETRIGK